MCSAPFFEPDPIKGVLGPTWAKKWPKHQNSNLYFCLQKAMLSFAVVMDPVRQPGHESVTSVCDMGAGGRRIGLHLGARFFPALLGTRVHSAAAFWLGCFFKEFVKDWKSVILGVWAAPGALETLPQTPKMTDFQSLHKFIFLNQAEVQPRYGGVCRTFGMSAPCRPSGLPGRPSGPPVAEDLRGGSRCVFGPRPTAARNSASGP